MTAAPLIVQPKSETYRSSVQACAFGPAPINVSLPVTPVDREYDVKTAYLLSTISGWAYSNGQTLADKLEHFGFHGNSVKQMTVVNNAMLVVATAFFVRSKDGSTGILAFRGTEPNNFLNW